MDFVDLALSKNGRDYFDLDIVDGDFKMTSGFDTALLMSIFCQKRASSSEVDAPEHRRGWWGNEALDFDDYEIGSKIWLTGQARAVTKTKNDIIDFINQSLEWFVEDGHLFKVETTAEYTIIKGQKVLNVEVRLFISENRVDIKSFRIWLNTGEIEIT